MALYELTDINMTSEYHGTEYYKSSNESSVASSSSILSSNYYSNDSVASSHYSTEHALVRCRQRALTAEEKNHALNVRKAKACWACHLSKIKVCCHTQCLSQTLNGAHKCSPCSVGTPCMQCTRIQGKRRFMLLSCFNDPLETLQVFLAPGKWS